MPSPNSTSPDRDVLLALQKLASTMKKANKLPGIHVTIAIPSLSGDETFNHHDIANASVSLTLKRR